MNCSKFQNGKGSTNGQKDQKHKDEGGDYNSYEKDHIAKMCHLFSQKTVYLRISVM